MDFNLNDEQQMLRDGVERFVREHYKFETRRDLLNTPEGFSRENWQQELLAFRKAAQALPDELLVDDALLLELKAVQEVLPIHKAQLLSYMKLLDVPLGQVLSFHEMRLVDGVSRMMLPGSNRT